MLISSKKSILLLLTMSVALFNSASCGEQSNDAEQDKQTAETSSSSSEINSDSGNFSVAQSKYDGVDYDGYQFRILSPSPGEHFYFKTSATENEIYYETENGDTLNDAIYRRNANTEELLNIEIVPVWGGDVNEVSSILQRSILSASDEFDVVLNRLDYIMNQAAEGGLVNYYDLDTIELTDPWWDKNIVESFTFFGNKLYTLSGDINYYDDYAVSALFMNKRICEELGYEPPYQLVRDGKWTWEEFTKMLKDSAHDVNGDGEINWQTDRIGYMNHHGVIQHMVYMFDEKLTKTEPDGSIVINNSEHLINVVDEIYRLVTESPDVYISTVDDGYTQAFPDGRVLFFNEMVGAIGGYREMTDDYSILPMPKGDESMKEYRAYVSNGWSTAYAIPSTNPDIERASTILDVMGAASTDTVTAALYDVMLQSKLIRDEESQEMLEYIFASKSYDIADFGWGSGLVQIYIGLATKPSNTFVSDMESMMSANESALEDFMESFKD